MIPTWPFSLRALHYYHVTKFRENPPDSTPLGFTVTTKLPCSSQNAQALHLVTMKDFEGRSRYF